MARRTAIACAALAAAAWVVMPGRPLVALGVLGGGGLIGLSYWALRGVVVGIGGPSESGSVRPRSSGYALVKFFTRHGMLALTAYVMLVPLHLDPIGMLIGVSSVVVAAAAEAVHRR